MFLPDSLEKQSAMKLNKHGLRWGKDGRTRQLIEIQESSERSRPIPQVNDAIGPNSGAENRAGVRRCRNGQAARSDRV